MRGWREFLLGLAVVGGIFSFTGLASSLEIEPSSADQHLLLDESSEEAEEKSENPDKP
ncbi:hypothetical protein Pan216_21630 [Planctomycetes bacterium Pan216]|uniref:Uncharacterized protein n=1 Tax=Kolteria novifilia TaxID=2527975 RepID=A0A518B2V7_9BACT|nr:hypothetical protein Pan216_21630 [Planctomycetes bacterium Pan216]